tara:strand:+ start:242 stop:505 length:264 start_codon:yes stop_codon:yes gene_type:complete
MKSYILKKLIAGYRVNPRHSGLDLVALPYKYTNEKILVKHGGKKMIIDQDTELLGSKTFEDKFGRDKTYTLYYYQWQPSKNQIKLEL